jgi:hypothetical protein
MWPSSEFQGFGRKSTRFYYTLEIQTKEAAEKYL